MVHDKQLLKDQMKIMQLIFKGKRLLTVLSKIITTIESRYDKHSIRLVAVHGCIGGKKLLKLIQSSALESKKNLDEPIAVDPKSNIIGRAAYDKHAIIKTTKNTYDHSLNFMSSFKNDININSSKEQTIWAIPIVSTHDELLGTLTIVYNRAYNPTNKECAVIEFYSKLIAVAIELLNDVKNRRHQSRLSLPLTDEIPQETLGVLLQLKKALINNEFTIYYQPIFDIDSNILGVEALLRWRHPKLGILPPAKFIEIAEATGFIIQMEEWVLDHAISEILKVRQNFDKNFALSVNISARQLDRKRFVHRLEEVLTKYNYNPKHLTLEITERFLMKKGNIEVMNQIKALGVRLAIDDFGTSYSSLQYLKHLPIDEIKIDRSFIADIDTNNNGKTIVEMIIKLAQALNITVVAEGVETSSQLSILKQLNCDQVQGFLYSRPLPLNSIVENIVIHNKPL